MQLRNWKEAKQERNKGGRSNVGKASKNFSNAPLPDSLEQAFDEQWIQWKPDLLTSTFQEALPHEPEIVQNDSWWFGIVNPLLSQKNDALLDLLGFSPHQKLTLALCMLAYDGM